MVGVAEVDEMGRLAGDAVDGEGCGGSSSGVEEGFSSE